MFLNIEKHNKDNIAIVDGNDTRVSYGELVGFVEEFEKHIPNRTLIFILCENSSGALAGYVACLSSKIVPLMISADMDKEMLDSLISIYSPEYLWVPQQKKDLYLYKEVFECYNYSLLKTELKAPELYSELSLLLTTSGSTGSAKFVRHTYDNVVSNAENVAKAFELDQNERAMEPLPLQFTQGLNVASSHLLVGATVLITTANIMQKEFWEFFKREKATSITGVPYSYEVMERLRFFNMDLPDLKTLNEGGGRLSDRLFMKCAEYAKDNGKRFMPTYGSTETTSRMAYLPYQHSINKCGSIGKALPGCKITLLDENGNAIDKSDEIGELVFEGPNVTLGYAECAADLAKGDERNGIYYTGDLAKMDTEGFIYIVGRKKRFVKIFGYRISLDEVERLVKGEYKIDCACVGTDKKITIIITEESKAKEIIGFLSNKMSMHSSIFETKVISEIPKNDTGKTQYKALESI